MWKGLSGVARRNFQDVQEFSKSVPEGARMCEELPGVIRTYQDCKELQKVVRSF